jgi:hypothetical protein
MAGRLVTIATFGRALEAEIARAKLGAHGIRSFVSDENLSTLNPHYIGAALGVRLAVREADADEARAILDEPPENAEDDGDDDDPEVAAQDGPRCPHCGMRYAYFQWPPWLALVSFALLGLPLLFVKKRWYCRKCEHSFTASPPASRPESPYRKPRPKSIIHGK